MTALTEKVAAFAAAANDADQKVAAANAAVAGHELAAAEAFASGRPDEAAEHSAAAHEARDRVTAAEAYRDLARSQHLAAAAELGRLELAASVEAYLAQQADLKRRSADAVAMAMAAIADARSYTLEAKGLEESARILNSTIEHARAELEGRPVSSYPSMACGPLPLEQCSAVAVESGSHRPETLVAALADGRL